MDAERIRKMTSNYMVKANPAYKDPNYVAFATPLPAIGGGGIVLKTKEVEVEKVVPMVEKKAVAPASTTTAPRRSASAVVKETSTKEAEEDGGENDDEGGNEETYEGKTFQEAQELLIAQMIKCKDDE